MYCIGRHRFHPCFRRPARARPFSLLPQPPVDRRIDDMAGLHCLSTSLLLEKRKKETKRELSCVCVWRSKCPLPCDLVSTHLSVRLPLYGCVINFGAVFYFKSHLRAVLQMWAPIDLIPALFFLCRVPCDVLKISPFVCKRRRIGRAAANSRRITRR